MENRPRFEEPTNPQESKIEAESTLSAKSIEMSAGMEIDYFGKTEQYQTVSGEEEKMTYNSNNGVIAFVDNEGRMRVAPATSDRFQALEEAGYKRGGTGVPFSNGELPTDPTLREQWEKMREEAHEQK